MATRNADAVWEGDLKSGKGKIKLGSGAFEGAYSFNSRFADGTGTNPEELIAAAHAGCFTMALSHALSEKGHKPDSVHTTAKVHLESKDGGFNIPQIDLVTEAKIPGIDNATFQATAEDAKKNCPVSKVLAAAKITLAAKLIS